MYKVPFRDSITVFSWDVCPHNRHRICTLLRAGVRTGNGVPLVDVRPADLERILKISPMNKNRKQEQLLEIFHDDFEKIKDHPNIL